MITKTQEITSKRCQFCLTRFTSDDYLDHMAAHYSRRPFPGQAAYEIRKALIHSNTRHLPSEPCNCIFYGVRNYCEVLHLESI